MRNVQVGIVKYGTSISASKLKKTIQRWLPGAEVCILNNQSGAAVDGELQGSNEYHEFSGYLELLYKLKSDGILLILNDTMFKTHFRFGWFWLIRKTLEKLEMNNPMILGDMRYDGPDLVERPNPFFASWIFVLSGEQAKGEFQGKLTDLLLNPTPNWSAEYEQFLTDWLVSKRWYKGWHRVALSETELQLKKRNIYWEHSLSKNLQQGSRIELQSLGLYYPRIYRFIRLMDRLSTAYGRMKQRIWKG